MDKLGMNIALGKMICLLLWIR